MTYDVTLTKMGEQQSIGQMELGSPFGSTWLSHWRSRANLEGVRLYL